MDDDLAIIEQVLAGDVDAFGGLVRRYQAPILGFAMNLLRDSTASEDVAQEAFMAAFRSLRRFDPGKSNFSTWLFSITRNKCLSALSRRRPASAEPATEEAIDTRSPESFAMEREWFARLDAALAGLPVDQQTAFVLAEMQGLPLSQIADIEGVELGTIKSRIHRAKDKLRAALAGQRRAAAPGTAGAKGDHR